MRAWKSCGESRRTRSRSDCSKPMVIQISASTSTSLTGRASTPAFRCISLSTRCVTRTARRHWIPNHYCKVVLETSLGAQASLPALVAKEDTVAWHSLILRGSFGYLGRQGCLRSQNLLRVFVGLHHSEDVAFGIFAVSQPAHTRDSHRRNSDRTSVSGCCRHRLGQRLDAHRTHIANHRCTIYRALPWV